MKKMAGLFCMVGLTFLLVCNTQVYASSSVEEHLDVVQYSRSITLSKVFNGNVVPPITHYYNDGAWTGTLYRDAYRYDGIRTIATYSGTVFCSKNCPIQSNSNVN